MYLTIGRMKDFISFYFRALRVGNNCNYCGCPDKWLGLKLRPETKSVWILRIEKKWIIVLIF